MLIAETQPGQVLGRIVNYQNPIVVATRGRRHEGLLPLFLELANQLTRVLSRVEPPRFDRPAGYAR